MIRQIIIPQQREHVIQFPEDMLGKRVEVVAFAIDDAVLLQEHNNSDSFERLRAMLKSASFKAGSWKFNRDEANDYDEGRS